MTAPTPPASPAVEAQMQALLDYPEMVIGRARCDISRGQTIIGDMLGDDGTGSLMRFAQSFAALAAPPTPRGEEAIQRARAIAEQSVNEVNAPWYNAVTRAAAVEAATSAALAYALSTPRAEIGDDARARGSLWLCLAAAKVVTCTTTDPIKALARIMRLAIDAGIVEQYTELLENPRVALLASDEPISKRRTALEAPCKVPPAGWSCSRKPGHDGPCAATPDAASVTPDAGEVAEAMLDAMEPILRSRDPGFPGIPWREHRETNPEAWARDWPVMLAAANAALTAASHAENAKGVS
jgi:hypothetical protein